MRKLINRIIFKIYNRSCSLGKYVGVSRKTIVGKNCKLESYCSLSPNVKLGNGVRIGPDTSLNNISVGDNSFIDGGVKIVGTSKGVIKMGNECYIGLNNVFDTSDNIVIGNYVHIAGPSTGLWCHSSAQMCLNSISLDANDRELYRPTAPITIEDNVYIGGNCTIYPGITIGHHSIIAPNSAVTKDVPPNTVVGGVPAIKIKNIK